MSPQHYSAREFEDSNAIAFILEAENELKNSSESEKKNFAEITKLISIYHQLNHVEKITFDLYIKNSIVTCVIYGGWLRYQMMYNFYNNTINE